MPSPSNLHLDPKIKIPTREIRLKLTNAPQRKHPHLPREIPSRQHPKIRTLRQLGRRAPRHELRRAHPVGRAMGAGLGDVPGLLDGCGGVAFVAEVDEVGAEEVDGEGGGGSV